MILGLTATLLICDGHIYVDNSVENEQSDYFKQFTVAAAKLGIMTL